MRAAACLRRAGASVGELRDSFLFAAENWLNLAEQLDRLTTAAPAKPASALAAATVS